MSLTEYIILFVLVAILGAGLPGPGDAALIAAGTLAGEGKLNVWIVLAVVAKREVDADERDPELDGPVGMRVGHQRPQPQGLGEFPAGRRDVSAVQGGTGLHLTGQGGSVGVLDPALAQMSSCAAGQDPRLVSLVACHRHQ
jgi:hypothetical protein